MRVAIVHDYLTQPGGAERVVLAMLRAFPDATLATSVYHPEGTFPEFGRAGSVRTSWLQHLPVVRRDPRLALPLLGPAFRHLRISDADVVLVSSSGWAHGVHTELPKVVYCHNPPRWLHQSEDYLAGQLPTVRHALAALSPWLHRQDVRAARSATRYLANSAAVAGRVYAAYGIDAEVVHPPVTVDVTGPRQPVPRVAPGFLLTVARGRGYKNVHVVEAAVADHLPDERLVVVGDAEPSPSHRIRRLGRVPEPQLRWLYENARALVSVSHEDFGLTPLEANAFGTPAVLLRAGGFLETLDEGVNGIFVAEPTPRAVASAVRELPDLDPAGVRAHAARFAEPAFAARLQGVLKEVASA